MASPRCVYTNGRCIDRLPNPDGVLPPLVDEGANISTVCRGIGEWGVRPMHGPTSDGRNSDAEPSNVNDEPKLGELEEEAQHLVVGEYGITSRGKTRRDESCAAIAAGDPIAVGIAGGSAAFQSYTGGIMPALHSELDNCVLVYGYETQPDGSVVFFIRNSWGTGWGENGNARLSQEAFDELDGMVVLDAHLKGAA